MKKLFTYLFFLVLLGGLSFLYAFSSHRNGEKKVQKVLVEFEEGSNYFFSQKMVDKLLILNQQEVQNQPKSIINLQGLEHHVVSSPYIEKAIVFLSIDGVLKAIVKQRTPVARVSTGSESYYIDKQGLKIPLSANYSARVLLVTGVLGTDNLTKITQLVNKVLSDDFLKKEVVGIYKTPKGEFVLSVRSGKQKVELGTLEHLNTKLKKLKAFYNKAYVDKTIEKYKVINLKYHNQVVCTK
ncbi:MAG: cell division protein FtsQ/DivIB [Polaribacter sp.]|nr:cell division protein FtsQ/DivIB [Polaribacter sp.]